MGAIGSQPTIIRTERGLTIAGTRVTLYDIMGYIDSGWPPHLIQQWLDLTKSQMAGALTYIAEHRAEVEAEYKLVLQQAADVRAYWEQRNQARLEKVAALPPLPGQEMAVERLRAWKAELAQP